MTRGPTLSAHRPPCLPKPLDAFNAAPADEAGALLQRCLRSPRWSRRITAHRPYPDLESLLAAADEAAYDLPAAEMAEALAGEPLAELPEDTYSAAHTALSAAHAAYKSRFGHTFVIYLGDTAPAEFLDRLLEAIRSRLANDPEEERVTAAEELRRLARSRLETYLRGAGPCTSAVPQGTNGHKATASGS